MNFIAVLILLILPFSGFAAKASVVSQIPQIDVVLSSIAVENELGKNPNEGQLNCANWRQICSGEKSCVRWVQASAQCYLCSRYATTAEGGQPYTLGRLITCQEDWKQRAESSGWICQARENPPGLDTQGRHCASWTQNCRWVCVN